ncbi:apicoplast calcium binding protein 1, putative [Plasmodium berghei]|uniref:non-specific serine/threonine protein kinase n=2 Tax=Plasmodium berghei TaxID=5821 RepID=A0A509AT24_PLABA|nr:apicoplast calcium binding protein 1, putative [Plasmodium berghei ANKA]CXJ00065.1 apicoplast calcium binding protein 1, putative [Plasmodium berghei]SCL97953.1 apicoplast calcium binding protein 1, putative [Plasmodium berghei]SCM16720.1 apicoplast calcium binding protein 1, putative [Plasmodium berghei]SCM18518.1 apicoplast calcium binding protein 1, putative [Plasmodium berghei]SCN27951.1 apicoplast calcium binding protein 1, putative [Plasmodium berghei]|eukprot:XP_034423604.1 apicoplast calcium binding protein 1, putative [Plasmodium berghei ANKA]
MKFLKFAMLGQGTIIPKLGILFLFIILILFSDSFTKNKKFEYLLNAQITSRKVCHLLQKNISILESLLICNYFLSNGFLQNDWSGLNQNVDVGIRNNGVYELNENKHISINREYNFTNRKGINEQNGEIKNEANKNDYSFNIKFDTNNKALTENVLKKAKISFKQLDKNNNNFVDFNEFHKNIKILYQIPKVNKNILNYLFKQFDIDNDNKLNYAEFVSLNSYDSTFLSIYPILFNDKNKITKDEIFNYLEIYFYEFLENVINDNRYFYAKNYFVYQCINSFFVSSQTIWDMNKDQKLQMDEFENFQHALIIEMEYLTNFLHLDINMDKKVDISELIFYIINDIDIYNKLHAYIVELDKKYINDENPKKENVIQYMKNHLNIENNIIFHIQLFMHAFDHNNDMALNYDEYKNQLATLSVLDNVPDIIYFS